MDREQIIFGEQRYNIKDFVLCKEKIERRKVDLKNTFHIAMTPSAEWVKWAGVLMESIMIKNSWLEGNLCFHILTDTLHNEDREKLQRFSERWNVSIFLYFMNDEIVKQFSQFTFSKRNGSNIYSIYYNLLIPYVMDEEIEKVLYLDVDTVCNKNIYDILHEKFDEYVLAVHDIQEKWCIESLNSTKQLGQNIKSYFCNGLLYMNIKKMQENHITEKIIQCLYSCVENNIDLSLVEQDAENIVMNGNVRFANSLYHYPFAMRGKYIKKAKVQREVKKAYFVHFLEMVKPWKVEAQDFPIVKVWIDAKANSEWNEAQLVGEWDLRAYRVAAKAAWINHEYLKWIKCMTNIFRCEINKNFLHQME